MMNNNSIEIKKLPSLLLLLVALVFLHKPLLAEEETAMVIEEPWIGATPPASRTAAMYMKLNNNADAADVLLSASCDCAEIVEFHTHIHQDGMMKMVEMELVEIPANGSLEFKPRAEHVMLIDISRQFIAGEKITVTLNFKNAGEIVIEADVRDRRR